MLLVDGGTICGIRQTMQYVLVFPMMDTASSTLHLAMANDIAIGGARHCESTCNCWKDTSDDCPNIHISEVESIDDSYQLKVGGYKCQGH